MRSDCSFSKPMSQRKGNLEARAFLKGHPVHSLTAVHCQPPTNCRLLPTVGDSKLPTVDGQPITSGGCSSLSARCLVFLFCLHLFALLCQAENNELLYPSIGLDRQGLAIRVNLGKSPFLFDLSSLAEKADMDGPVPFILTDDFSDTESEGADVVGLWQYADSSDEEEESSDTHDSGNEEDESSDEESNISHTESEGQDVEEANAGVVCMCEIRKGYSSTVRRGDVGGTSPNGVESPDSSPRAVGLLPWDPKLKAFAAILLSRNRVHSGCRNRVHSGCRVYKPKSLLPTDPLQTEECFASFLHYLADCSDHAVYCCTAIVMLLCRRCSPILLMSTGGTGPEAIDHGDSGPGGSPPGDAL